MKYLKTTELLGLQIVLGVEDVTSKARKAEEVTIPAALMKRLKDKCGDRFGGLSLQSLPADDPDKLALLKLDQDANALVEGEQKGKAVVAFIPTPDGHKMTQPAPSWDGDLERAERRALRRARLAIKSGDADLAFGTPPTE